MKIKMSYVIQAFQSLPKIFKLIYQYDKKYLLIMLLEMVAFSIDQYPALFIMKYTIDAFTNGITYSHYVAVLIPLIVAAFLVKMIRIVVNTSRPCRDQVLTDKLFDAFFAECMKIDYETLENKQFQDKKELAKFMANGKITAIGWYFVEMFSSMIALIIAFLFLFQTNPILPFPLIAGFLVKAYLVRKHSEKTIPLSKQLVTDKRYLSYLYQVGSDYEYVKEFRLFGYNDKLFQKIKKAKEKYLDSNQKLENNHFFYFLLSHSEDFLLRIFTFLFMGFISLSDFSFVIGLMNDCISYTNSFAISCKTYVEAVAYIQHYVEFMDHTWSVGSKKPVCELNSTKQHVIEFRNVSFQYPNSSEYVLKGINLKIQTPMKLSIAGHNGAGKSTLIKLLLRLYKPQEGSITLDGTDIFEYDRKEYMSLFSSVFQDYILFAFTIQENISSFDDNMDISKTERVSRDTGVSEFISNYPLKYETYLSNAYSNDGLEFSGGEQQKIALARSVYKEHATFFILDEPTSTYDADAEYKLYKKYEELLSQKCSIFISHRLSSCKLSDKIILLQNGQIVEEGSFEELTNRETQFKQIYDLQSKQYQWGENHNAR